MDFSMYCEKAQFGTWMDGFIDLKKKRMNLTQRTTLSILRTARYKILIYLFLPQIFLIISLRPNINFLESNKGGCYVMSSLRR